MATQSIANPINHLDCTKKINCGYCKNVGIPCPKHGVSAADGSEDSSQESNESIRNKKIMAVTGYASSVGFLAGLTYAFVKKKGFWSYVGFSLLGSLAIGTAGNLIARPLIKK